MKKEIAKGVQVKCEGFPYEFLCSFDLAEVMRHPNFPEEHRNKIKKTYSSLFFIYPDDLNWRNEVWETFYGQSELKDFNLLNWLIENNFVKDNSKKEKEND